MSTKAKTAPAAEAPAAATPAHPRRRPSTFPVAISGRAGYTPLGYTGPDGLTSVVWSEARRSLVYLEPTAMAPQRLQAVVGREWAAMHYTREDAKGGSRIEWSLLASDIIDACERAGRFTRESVMGGGVWKVPGPDGIDIVINTGSELISLRGNTVPRISKAGVFTESDPLGISASTPSATDGEVLELAEFFETWSYQSGDDAVLAFGWIAVSALAGALDRRPIMHLTGPRGCGKTSFIDALTYLLGGSCLSAPGTSTPAGIRQTIGDAAKVLILDEFGDNKATAGAIASTDTIIAMAREWYSSGASKGTLRGGADGVAKAYSGKVMPIFAGILPPDLQPADRSRFVRVALSRLPAGTTPHPLLGDERRLAELGAKLRMRMFRLFDTLEASIEVFKSLLRASVSELRTAENIALLLAGWYVATRGRVPTLIEAQTVIANTNVGAHARAMDESSDERDCADWMLGALIRTGYGDTSVSTAIEHARAGDKEHASALALAGMRISVDGKSLLVCASKALEGTREVFAKSKFAGGGWTILERAPGAARTRARLCGMARDAISIPLSWLLCEEVKPEQQALELSAGGVK